MPFSCCEPRFPPRYSNSPPYSNSPHLIVCPTVTLGADLPGKPRADGVPHTPRVLAYKVEDAITTAKSAARLPEVPPCDRHWDERFDDAAPLTPEQQRAAASLGFTPRTWKGGGGPAPSDTPTNVAKKRCSLAHFRARAPSQLPEMQMDVLGMQLHRPKLDPPPASPAAAAEAPAVSSAVRSCARGAIAGVLTTCRQEGEDAVVRWVIMAQGDNPST